VCSFDSNIFFRATIDKLNRELDQEKVFQYKVTVNFSFMHLAAREYGFALLIRAQQAPSTPRPVNQRLVTPRAHQQKKVPRTLPAISFFPAFSLALILHRFKTSDASYPTFFPTQKHQPAPEAEVVTARRPQGSSAAPGPFARPSSSPPVSVSLKSLVQSTSPNVRSGGYEMPILFVDVKLKDGSFDRISVHRGDDIGLVRRSLCCCCGAC
jgi:hypothetical protein